MAAAEEGMSEVRMSWAWGSPLKEEMALRKAWKSESMAGKGTLGPDARAWRREAAPWRRGREGCLAWKRLLRGFASSEEEGEGARFPWARRRAARAEAAAPRTAGALALWTSFARADVVGPATGVRKAERWGMRALRASSGGSGEEAVSAEEAAAFFWEAETAASTRVEKMEERGPREPWERVWVVTRTAALRRRGEWAVARICVVGVWMLGWRGLNYVGG